MAQHALGVGMTMGGVVIGRRGDLVPEVLEAMCRTRRSVSCDPLHWPKALIGSAASGDLGADDGVYVVVRNVRGEVTSSARLSPTTRDCLLSQFPQLLGGAPVPSDPWIWELGRFANSIRLTRDNGRLGFARATIELLDLVLRYAQRCSVRRLVMMAPLALEVPLMRTNLDVLRIAPPAVVDGVRCVGLTIEVPAATGDVVWLRSSERVLDRGGLELTQTQRTVMRWVAAGKTAEEIGQIMSMTKHGVVFHINKVKGLLDAKNVAQAVARAMTLGLL